MGFSIYLRELKVFVFAARRVWIYVSFADERRPSTAPLGNPSLLLLNFRSKTEDVTIAIAFVSSNKSSLSVIFPIALS
jgi:hypothetical protein